MRQRSGKFKQNVPIKHKHEKHSERKKTKATQKRNSRQETNQFRQP
jgi:hypothetical protein